MSRSAVLSLVVWVLYFLFPRDVVPDYFFPLGWLDDLLLLFAVLFFIRRSGGLQFDFPANGVLHFKKDNDFHGLHKGKRSVLNPYEVLGIPPGATEDEIRKAYKLLMVQYHPDKVQHLGTDLQLVAKKKSAQIMGAYDALSKAWTTKA